MELSFPQNERGDLICADNLHLLLQSSLEILSE